MNTLEKSSMTRRQFGKAVAAGGSYLGLLGALPRAARANSSNRRLRIACVGAAGKGWDDLRGVSGEGRLHDIYHNFNWRAWQEYGSGMLGDMGCHVMDVVVWALELGAPTAIRAEVSNADDLVYPDESTVTYEFPATRHTHQNFRYTWLDGLKKEPPIDKGKFPEGFKLPSSGSLLVGDEGWMLASAGSPPRLYPQEKFRDYTVGPLKQMFADLASEKLDHYVEWPNAILAGRPANSSFDVSGPPTEIVMLGTIAQRVPGRRLVWDAAKLRFDHPAATALVRRQYRKGWAIDALHA